MTILEAIKMVRNMAYELTNRGYILHDLNVEDDAALDLQTEAIDTVDEWLLNGKLHDR